MELEKTLYRIHEKLLGTTIVVIILKLIFVILLLISCFLMGVFIYANIVYKDQSICFKTEYNAFKKLILLNKDLPKDEVINVKIVDMNYTSTNMLYSKLPDDYFNQTLNINETINSNITSSNSENNLSFVRDNRNFSEFYTALHLNIEIMQIPHLLSMPNEIKKKHDFISHEILIDSNCYSENNFFKYILFNLIGIENILINEILFTVKTERFILIKNLLTFEIWSWLVDDIYSYSKDYNIFFKIIKHLFGIIEIVIGMFLSFSITSIYIKMTIICSPIFILMITECCIKLGVQDTFSRLPIYRSFPWIGLYLYALVYNNKKAERLFQMAFICMIFLFYFIYLISASLWDFFLFHKSIPNGLNESFYGLIALLEFLSILFIRTRSSFKYIPIFTMTSLFLFLYYVKFNLYGFNQLALSLISCIIIGFFLLNLVVFEAPALDWNPSFHYAPSLDKPRLLYFPLFSLSTYYDLPHFWSMFYPLHDRSYFNNSQMSLIDRNFVLLNSTMEQARNNQNNNINNNNNNNFDLELQSFLQAGSPQISNQENLPPQNNIENRNNLFNQVQENNEQILANNERDLSLNQNLLRNENNNIIQPSIENVALSNLNKKNENNEKYNQIE